jgi:hypothetical protein
MGTIYTLLPRLNINRQFVEDFMSADVPCFAMGVVEERKSPRAVLALRTAETIPSEIAQGGFNFGHSLFGNSKLFILPLNSIISKLITSWSTRIITLLKLC